MQKTLREFVDARHGLFDGYPVAASYDVPTLSPPGEGEFAWRSAGAIAENITAVAEGVVANAGLRPGSSCGSVLS